MTKAHKPNVCQRCGKQSTKTLIDMNDNNRKLIVCLDCVKNNK